MKHIILLLLACVLLAACRDIIEKDITNDTVELVSPTDNARSGTLLQTLYWNPLDGVQGYRVQITKNNFNPDSIFLVMDSTVKATQFSYGFSVGKYQWRVSGVNSAYNSKFSNPRTLHIDSSSDVGIQILELVSPEDKSFTNQLKVPFSWKSLPQASSYRVQIDTGNGTSLESNISTTTFAYTFMRAGSYSWRVQGVDSKGKSTAFSSRTLIIDQTTPVVTPTSSTTVVPLGDSTTTVTWKSADNPPNISGIYSDSIYVFSDSLGTLITGFPKLNNTGSQIISVKLQTNAPVYRWWKATTIDNAQNHSINSTPFKITFPATQ
jgi:hypothetical protein